MARENIKRFEARLEACTDDEQRKILEQLLERERERLAQVQAGKRRQG